MNPTSIREAESQLLVPTYQRPSPVFVRGEGVFLFDSSGKSYLDFASGIAVTALGHSDPQWVEAIAEQARMLTHVSNLFHTTPQVELAQRLVTSSFADRVFFSNSGTEANEAAFKFARKWGHTKYGKEKVEVIAFTDGFHGRTCGALSLTYKSKYREPFQPLVPGVTFATYNDLESVRQAMTTRTCAIIVEPVQGEGGVRTAAPEFLQGLRELCDDWEALLILDEVQCGLGRTGYLWAHETYGITPDLMTLAKPLAGGLPIGATLVTEDVSKVIKLGDHGCTFGAGPLVCRAAQIVFDRISQESFLESVRSNAELLDHSLQSLPSAHIVEIRQAGLLVGVEFDLPVQSLIQTALEQGLIVINAGENVLRICPPLIIDSQHINDGVQILRECLPSLESQ
jgi:predicted acetylornithine/succinylornithine family transaminase